MTLARVKTWVASTTLSAADLNGEFDNILANPITLISPTTGAVDFNNQAHTNFRAENLAADPSAGNTGRIWYDTVNKVLKVDSGSTVGTIGPVAVSTAGAVGSRVRGLRGTISSGQGTFQAVQYTMQTTNPYTLSWVVADTAQFTVDMATAGPAANGRDKAGNISAGDTVYWYAISTGVGATSVAGLCSTRRAQGTGAPAMPTSYSGFTFLCASVLGSTAVNKLSSAFGQKVAGAWTLYDAYQSLLSGGVASSVTNVSATALAPLGGDGTVDLLRLLISANATAVAAGGAAYGQVFLYQNGLANNVVQTRNDNAGLSGITVATNTVDVIYTSSQGVQYNRVIVSGTAASADMQVLGWHNANGE